jgi:hypothetical protein
MGGPSWLADIFAAVMLAVAAYSASRLIAARWWRRPTELDADGVHVLMGVAMAGMLVAGLRILPAGLWEAVFAASAVYFSWEFVRQRQGAGLHPWRCPHPVPHLVESGAMVFMLLLIPVLASGHGPAMGAMGGAGMSAAESRFSLLTLLLALFMFGYVMWLGNGLTVPVPVPAVTGSAGALPSAGAGQLSSLGLVAAPGPVAAAGRAGEPDGTWAPASPAGAVQAVAEPEPAVAVARGGCGVTAARLARPFIAPRCATCCKIAMGVTMGYMLILML